MKTRTVILSVFVICVLSFFSGCDVFDFFGNDDSDGSTSGTTAAANYRIKVATFTVLDDVYTYEYEYTHSNGALCTKSSNYFNGTLNSYSESTYDVSGNLIRADSKDTNGNLLSYTIYSDYNSYGEYETLTTYQNGTSTTQTYSYVYDGSGNIKVMTVYTSSTYYSTIESAYDDKGNPVSTVAKTYNDGSLVSTSSTTMTNVYDANSNLIKVTYSSPGSTSSVYEYTWEKY